MDNDSEEHQLKTAKQKGTVSPLTPFAFGAVTALLVALFEWPRKWLISGAPILTLFILLGSSKGNRVLPVIPIWTFFTTLNIVYAVAATSWLLYGLFIAGCYPAIFLTCLFQFSVVADVVRRFFRLILKQFQFVNDKVAFFDIPALEIDTDVDGLMVVRGLTFSLSTLTIVAHGVEVGIKLSDDMELAIQTETVTIALFRKIEITEVFANIKGGTYEMTFGDMKEKTHDGDGDALMVEDTPLLRVAAASGDTSRPKMVKMTSRMTYGGALKDSSAQSVLNSMTQLSPDDRHAGEQYRSTIEWIEETNEISQCREKLKQDASNPEAHQFDTANIRDIRAAICSQLHDKPSIPHPPRRSIKVTTLQNLSPPHVREILHRLPLLLRLLLNPLSYFHPVYISSVTAAGSGRWITHLLQEKIFQHYGQDNAELRRLEEKVSAWLSDANFALELGEITGLAQVPITPSFDILCNLVFGDVLAYRTLPKEVNLKQVLRLGGADAAFKIPSFLLPHHEHLIPPVPSKREKREIERGMHEADGKPHLVQKEHELAQAEKDETNVKISVHARLPACFDQDLLNFIAALVKATKVVELEKEPSAMDQEVSGFRDFTHSLHRGMKDNMKKVMVDSIVNDRWIAKLVGRITQKLETAQGDVGYSGNIPVALEIYRLPEHSREVKKWLA